MLVLAPYRASSPSVRIAVWEGEDARTFLLPNTHTVGISRFRRTSSVATPLELQPLVGLHDNTVLRAR